MGVFKNDVGRPSNKTIMIRRILILVMVIVIIALAILLGYFINDNSHKETKNVNSSKTTSLKTTNSKTTNPQTTTSKVDNLNGISENTVLELLSLVGLSSLSGKIDYTMPYSIIYWLSKENGEISNLSNYIKAELVFQYANFNNMLGMKDAKELSGEASWNCAGGTGFCYYITTSQARDIASKYGINNLKFFNEVSNKELYGNGWLSDVYKYNDKYLFTTTGGYYLGDGKYEVSASYLENSSDIVLSVKTTVVKIDDDNPNSSTAEDIKKENLKVGNSNITKLTYKLGSQNKYYLYSVYAE